MVHRYYIFHNKLFKGRFCVVCYLFVCVVLCVCLTHSQSIQNIQQDLDLHTLEAIAASEFAPPTPRYSYSVSEGMVDADGELVEGWEIAEELLTIQRDANREHEVLPPDDIPLHLRDSELVAQWEWNQPLQDNHYGLPLYASDDYDSDLESQQTMPRLLQQQVTETTTTTVIVNVTSVYDSSDHNALYCYPLPTTMTNDSTNSSNTVISTNPYYNPVKCNLRSAWDVCSDYSSSASVTNAQCTIHLPENTPIGMNTTLGALKAVAGMSVRIEGHNATVYGTDNTYSQITATTTFNGTTSSFPLTTGVLTNTATTTQNYVQACIPICPGITIRFSSCAAATFGDTYLRLVNSGGSTVSTNDDYCGYSSQLTYTVPLTVPLTRNGTCPVYCLRMGCYGSKTCTMGINAYVIRVNPPQPPPQFISYISTSVSSAPPYLSLNNFTVRAFGSLIYTGAGAINITGNASISLSYMTFADNQATIGGAMAIVNNNYTHGTVHITQCTFIHNCAMSEGGSLYLSRTSVHTDIQSVNVINNHATYGGFMSLNVNSTHVSVRDIHAVSTSVTNSGVMLYTSKYANNVTFSAFTISECASYSSGLFVFLSNSSHLTFDDGVVANVKTLSGTCGLYGTANISDVTMSRTTWTGLTGSYGAIALSSNVSNILIQDLYSDNILTTGGVIYFSTNVTNVALLDLSMHRCENPTSLGGCVFLLGTSNVVMKGITMSNSYSKSDAPFIGLNSNVKNALFENVFLTNGSSQANAPFLIGTNGTNIALRNVTMTNCLAGTGGCLRMTRGNNATLQSLVFINCTTRSTAAGGAIDIYIYPNMSISDVTIAHSTARGTGGGISVDMSANVTIARMDISHCSVPSSVIGNIGGGLYLGQYCNNFTYVNSTVSECSAYNGGGIGVNAYNNYVNFAGLSITDNFAAGKGGGLYVGQYNYELLITDLDAFEHVKVIETNHPYTGKAMVGGLRQTIFAANATCPGATELIVNFDQLSTVQGIDTVNIYAFIPVPNHTPNATSLYVKRKTLVYSGYSNFPGVGIPSLRVPGDSIYVEFLGAYGNYIIATGLYGFRLYVYPVTGTPVHHPTILRNNRAVKKGGGMFFFYVNSFSVLTNVLVESNAVLQGDGGGLSMQIGNGGTAMQQVKFVNNSAYYDGGGLVLLSGQFGVSMRTCEFLSNRAVTGSGGGLFLASSNGDGILVTRNNITCTLCVFDNNTASVNGGGLYLSDENYLSVNATTFTGNSVTSGDGGAIGLGGYGTAYFQDCHLHDNTASNCGGGLSAARTSTLYFTNISVSGNVAAVAGGGLCLHTGTTLSLRGRVRVEDNVAAFVGGGIAMFQSPLWSIDSTHSATLSLSRNTASRGSALSLYQLPATNKNVLQNVLFSGNVARQGPTVYWVYDSVMSSEPPGLSSPSNQWYNNTVLTGTGESGTQAVYVLPPTVYNVTAYGTPVYPPIVVELQDYYHQTMEITGVTTIYPSLLIDGTERCSQYPFLSGDNLFASGVSMSQGIAEFANLEAYCSPGGNVTLSFEAEVGSLTGFPAQWRSTYYISNTTFMQFRRCRAGEYETKGMCQPCPLSTYNLISDTATSCVSCQSVTGVSACYEDQIIVETGYWRRYPTSSAVLACLLTPSSCVGGNLTSDSSCATGYTGPLCAVCAEGYFLSDTLCLPCDGGGTEMSPTAIAVTLLITVSLSLSLALIYYRYGRRKTITVTDAQTGEPTVTTLEPSSLELVLTWCKLKYNELMVKIKILVSTYQVVISTAGVFSVSMPITFTKFSNSLNFLNLGFTSIFPLGCSKRFTYYDTLLWTTLIPLLICGILVVGFVIEYVITRHRIQSNPLRQHGDKRRAFNRIKSKYLSFMFYLTYLVLPSVTTTIFQVFICTNIDPHSEDNSQYDYYLTADMSISCESDEYYAWIPFVIVMILIYPIGIPAMYFAFLFANRDEIKDRVSIVEERTNPMGVVKEEKGTESGGGTAVNGMRLSSRERTHSGSNSNSNTPTIAVPVAVANPLHNSNQSPSQTVTRKRLASASSSTTNSVRGSIRHSTSTSTSKHSDSDVVLAWEQAVRDVESGKSLDSDDPDWVGNEIDESSHLTVSTTRLMFLWQSYKPFYWYFELVETTRRIVLTAVLSVCSPGTSSQSVFGVILSFLYLLYYGIHQPYDSHSDFVLAEIGQIQIFFTFFSALIVQNELLSPIWVNGLGVLLTMINLSIVFITLQYEVTNYREEQKEREEEAKAVRERVLDVARKQRQLFAEKLRADSVEYDGSGGEIGGVGGEEWEGDGGNTLSPNKPQFRKTSVSQLMVSTLSERQGDGMEESGSHARVSVGGIELREMSSPSSQKSVEEMRASYRQRRGSSSIRLSDVKIDSDDDSDDEVDSDDDQ